MKKLAVVDLMFRWPPDGGARVDLKEVVSRLAKHYDVRVFAPRVDCIIPRGVIEESLAFDVETIPFTPGEFTGPKVASRFRDKLDRFNPDLIMLADGFYMKPWAAAAIGRRPYIVRFYAYENFCNRFNGTFMRGDRSCYRTQMGNLLVDKVFCTLCGLKSVIDARRIGSPGFYREYCGARAWSPMQWRRIRAMLDGAHSIIVYNQMFRQVIRRCGWDATVLPGGIETARFPLLPRRKEPGPVRLGLVGRINDSYKGIVHAVRALRLLHGRGIDAELHVTGTPQDSPLALPGVVFRGWFIRDSIKDFYRSIDICLIPSVWPEPFGIVALEAMCSGRPVIASRVAGLMETIVDSETGLLVAPQSAADIADAVQRYLDNPDLTDRIVQQAAREVRDRYDWDSIVETGYLPVFDNILNRRK